MNTKSNKLKIAVGMVLGAALLSNQAQANPLTGNVEVGTATLATFTTSLASTDNLLVDYAVNLSGGIYTYSYEIENPITDLTTSGHLETVDSFNVTFDTTALGNYITASVLGGTGQAVNASGITWTLAPVIAGHNSPVLSFQSFNPPSLGNDNASDAIPPSPWASTAPGGQMVPVPNVPDGGLTFALMGAALTTLGLVRTKVRSQK